MKKVNYSKIARNCALVAIFIAAAATVALTLAPHETHSSISGGQVQTSILDCVSDNPETPFFYSNEAKSASHEVKMIFKNEHIDSLSYTYTGTFDSERDAEEALSWLHGDYNNYMGTVGVYQESLTPTFTALGSEAIINIFIPLEYYNSATAKFLFLEENESSSINIKSISEIERIYNNKGFICK